MKHPEELLAPYSLWRHRKTTKTYVVLGIATCCTNGARENTERSVWYRSTGSSPQYFYREVSEFLDGRFDPIET